MSGQSIVDRLNAAKHTVAGSALGRAVVKATTEEIMGPKRKHLDYLLQCTSEINVSIPQMADLLIERTQNTSWVVTFKSLITIHHLMCYGNERFSQYMASHNSKFILNNFMDKTGIQGVDMSSYIRKYAHYLNEKRETYKLMGFDFCKVKRGKDDGMLRTMATDKLLKTLPILQKQLDALVAFDIQPNELTNGVINSCFVLLSKDLIRLFACYNDGIINLLEKFFDMNKKNCKEALEIYKKFLERTDSVSAFLKVAESSGMDKSDIPDLAKAPSSLLEALESHVNSGESKKGAGAGPAAASSSTKSSVTNAINSLNSNTVGLSAEEKRRVLEEEAKTLEAFKSSHLKKQTSLSSPTGENPFSGTNGTSNGGQYHNQPKQAPNKSNQDDLFGLDLTNGTAMANGSTSLSSNPSSASASDDLLMLSGANPFIQNIVNQSYAAQSPVNPFQTNGLMMQGVAPQQVGLFSQPPQSNFPMNPINPMLSNQNKLDDLFSGLTFPSTSATTPTQSNATVSATEFDAFGDVMQPTNKNSVLNPTSALNSSKPNLNGADKNGADKMISTDLDTTLASLADNLDINNKNKIFQKNHQWNPNSMQGQLKTGGQNWKPAFPPQTPQAATPMATSWNPTIATTPVASPMNTGWNANPFGAPGIMQPNMGMQAKPGIVPQAPVKPVVQPSNNPFDLF